MPMAYLFGTYKSCIVEGTVKFISTVYIKRAHNRHVANLISDSVWFVTNYRRFPRKSVKEC